MKKYLRRSAASVTKVLNYYMPPSPEKRAKKAKCEKTMCCGSEAFLTPGFGMREKIKIRIWNEHPGSYFREIRNYFFFKIKTDPEPGSGKEKFGSGINIPNPQR